MNAGIFNSGLLARPQPRPDARFDYDTVASDVLERAARMAGSARSSGSTCRPQPSRSPGGRHQRGGRPADPGPGGSL